MPDPCLSIFLLCLQVWISREDSADLCVSLQDLSAAVGTTFEMISTIPSSQSLGRHHSSRWGRGFVLAAAGIMQGVTGQAIDGVYTGKQLEDEVVQLQTEAAVWCN